MSEDNLNEFEKAELTYLGRALTPEEREHAASEVRRPVRHRVAEFYLKEILGIPIKEYDDVFRAPLKDDFPVAALNPDIKEYEIYTWEGKHGLIVQSFNPYDDLNDAMYLVDYLTKSYDMEVSITYPWKTYGSEFADSRELMTVWLCQMNVPLPADRKEWESLSMYSESESLLRAINNCLHWLHFSDTKKELWAAVKAHRKGS